jgi:hypothetical protein
VVIVVRIAEIVRKVAVVNVAQTAVQIVVSVMMKPAAGVHVETNAIYTANVKRNCQYGSV